MSYQTEQILSQFKDSWIPATWLSALITIREEDWTVIINAEAMTEITNWWYEYNFTSYEKSKTYLIDTDWTATLSDSDRYQSTTNILDAYPNKKDWKGSWWGVSQMVDTKKLAKDVWLEKTKDYEKKKGTMWQRLTEINNNDVLESIDNIEIPDNKTQIQEISNKSDTIINNQKEIVWEIESCASIVVDTIWEINKTVDKIDWSVNIAKWEIINEVELRTIETRNDVLNIEKIDYNRIKKDINEIKTNLNPVMFEINELKRTMVDEIKKNNYTSMREYISKSIDVWFVAEQSKELVSIKKDFNNALLEIKDNINVLSEKEIDMSEIINWVSELWVKIESWKETDVKTAEELTRQYKQSMKYIIYISKNIWDIRNWDIAEIKKNLSKLS